MKKHHLQETYDVKAPPTSGPTACPRVKQPMMMPFKKARLSMGTAAATHVIAPLRMPEPPTPVTALAAMSAEEERASPATREPIMKMATNAIMVNLSGKSRKSLPARGDMGQLHNRPG